MILYGLLFLSARNAFLHIGTSYNYSLDLGKLSTLVASPTNWAYLLREVFPNARNLPLLWLFEGIVAMVGTAVWWVGRGRLSSR